MGSVFVQINSSNTQALAAFKAAANVYFLLGGVRCLGSGVGSKKRRTTMRLPVSQPHRLYHASYLEIGES